MTLTLRPGKNGVRFEYSDADAETVISIDKADTDEDMIRKLKRVIALVEGEQEPSAPIPPPGRVPKYPALDALPPTNRWAAVYGPPPLPERLKGEVELVRPGEET